MTLDEHLILGRLLLPRGSVLRIDDGREMLVSVRRGFLWITHDRDRRDVMLEIGERFRIACGGCTLIEAMRDSMIALASPYEKSFARRIEIIRPGAGRPRPIYQGERGWRGAVAALTTNLMKTWVGLYAPPPRRASVRLD
jgi:hypothetical protein